MTPEEAREEVKYLRSKRAQLGREIESVVRQFCGQSVSSQERHYFLRLWQKVGGSDLYRVVSYVCVLCQVQKPLEQKGSRCPVCNELWDEDSISNEDVVACVNCGFNNLSGLDGLTLWKVPKGDEINLSFEEF